MELLTINYFRKKLHFRCLKDSEYTTDLHYCTTIEYFNSSLHTPKPKVS